MYDFLLYALAGASVGFVVGMTGVGGGSLMTPILLAFGFTPTVAIGTDLLYAAITKAGGVIAHARQSTVNWKIVRNLLLGSLPASVVTMALLKHLHTRGIDYSPILTTTLGVMLILTSLVLFFRTFLLHERDYLASGKSALAEFEHQHATLLTIVTGISLGALVTLSSVGAGAFGAAVLMVLYPRLPMIQVIGTDLAHAVPLTAVAGLGHLHLGNVDFNLLAGLLLGSLPAIWLGTKAANRMPEKIMQRLVAFILIGLGVNYTFF
ncbi:MAG TPA: sulfite exporter TauE/SafE family protein [Gammaproteobacteria bacterium]